MPISAKNVELIPADPGTSRKELICRQSRDADLIILGLVGEALLHQKDKLFRGYDGVGNILWVNTKNEIQLSREEDEEAKKSPPLPSEPVAAEKQPKNREIEPPAETPSAA